MLLMMLQMTLIDLDLALLMLMLDDDGLQLDDFNVPPPTAVTPPPPDPRQWIPPLFYPEGVISSWSRLILCSKYSSI